MYHVTRARIDMSAAEDNYRHIRTLLSEQSEADLICVVKADAYGHGVKSLAALYRSLGARSFAVSNLDEAIELRRTVGDEPMILVLGYTDPAFAAELCRHGLTQTVFSEQYARALSARLPADLPVHIKLDTGMNRLGFRADADGVAQAVRAARLPHLRADGVFTHFAVADQQDGGRTRAQFDAFAAASDAMRAAGVDFRMRHACNSAGTLRFPEMHLDAVRCGIILYGLNPSEQVRDPALRPVMSLYSRVIHIHTVAPGEQISYGGCYTARRELHVATVPIGYDDGLPRVCARQFGVYVNGKFAKILGRICMDQCMVDVTDVPCTEGDEVEIIGPHQSADVLAKASGTINYEVTCTVGKRVPRDEVRDHESP